MALTGPAAPLAFMDEAARERRAIMDDCVWDTRVAMMRASQRNFEQGGIPQPEPSPRSGDLGLRRSSSNGSLEGSGGGHTTTKDSEQAKPTSQDTETCHGKCSSEIPKGILEQHKAQESDPGVQGASGADVLAAMRKRDLEKKETKKKAEAEAAENAGTEKGKAEAEAAAKGGQTKAKRARCASVVQKPANHSERRATQIVDQP